MNLVFFKALNSSAIVNSTKDILALGLQSTATSYFCRGVAEGILSFKYWLASLKGSYTYDIVTDAAAISSIAFTNYKMIYLPSQKVVSQCATTSKGKFGYTLCAIESALTLRRLDIMDYVNSLGGSIVALEQSVQPIGTYDPGCPNAFGWLPLVLTSTVREITYVLPTEKLTKDIPSIVDGSKISHNSYHVVFTGPAGFAGLAVLIYDASQTSPEVYPYVLGGANVVLTNTSYPTR
jgi:hypothetical protein